MQTQIKQSAEARAINDFERVRLGLQKQTALQLAHYCDELKMHEKSQQGEQLKTDCAHAREEANSFLSG